MAKLLLLMQHRLLDELLFTPLVVAGMHFIVMCQRWPPTNSSAAAGLLPGLLFPKLLLKEYRITINVCDAEPYEFGNIISTFRRSGIHSNRPVIPIPAIADIRPPISDLRQLSLHPKKKQWLHSAYEKLTQDLVFDNSGSDL